MANVGRESFHRRETMHVGRNDPCPCGSGKKYKKCCLPKDQEKQAASAARGYVPYRAGRQPPRKAAERATTQAGPDTGPETPWLEDAGDSPVEAFQGRDYEECIALFHQELEAGSMDQDSAFEMLSELHRLAVLHGQRERFKELVAALRRRMPEAYAADAPYYLDFLIADAIALGRSDDIAPLAREMAEAGETNVDVLFRTVNRLMYHGRTTELVQMVRLAWPWLGKGEGDIVPWGIDEFADLASEIELMDYVEQAVSPGGGDPNLVERLGTYCAVDPGVLQEHVGWLTKPSQGTWKLEEIQLGPDEPDGREEPDGSEEADDSEAPGRPAEPGGKSLNRLSIEFMGHVVRNTGVPHTRAALARREMLDYLAARRNGDLDDNRSLVERMAHPRKARPRKIPRDDHPLCPDRATLDFQLARLLEFLNPRPYRAAALFELIPPWLSFLESKGLLDAEQRKDVLGELEPLSRQLPGIVERYADEPCVAANVRAPWMVE